MGALTDLTTFKAHLGIGASNPSDTTDAYLTSLIDRASAFVDTVVGRTLLQTAHVEYYDGGGSCIELRNGPVKATSDVPGVTLAHGTWGTGGWTQDATVDLGDFVVVGWRNDSDPVEDVRASRLEQEGGFSYIRQGWKVSYTAGFLLADVPDDVVQATLHAATWFKNRRLDAATAARTVGDDSMAYDQHIGGLRLDVRAMLARYCSERVL